MYAYQRQVEYFQVRLDMPANKVDIKAATQKLGTKPVPQTFVWPFTFCWQAYQDELRKSPKNVSDTRTYPHRCSPVKRHENIQQEHPLRNSRFLFKFIPDAVIGTKKRGPALARKLAGTPVVLL